MRALINLTMFLNRAVEYLVSSFMGLIVVAICWQVFSRYILGSPSAISGELARYLLIWIGLFGAAHGYRHRVHLSLSLFTEKFSELGQKLTRLLSHVTVFCFAVAVMCVGGIKLVLLTLQPVQLSPVLEIKIAYVYVAIPVVGAIIAINALVFLLSEMRNSIASTKG